MEQSLLEILLEDIRSKFELVLEGHSVLNSKIDAFRADTEAHSLYQVREPSP